jgi:hypothetical protein
MPGLRERSAWSTLVRGHLRRELLIPGFGGDFAEVFDGWLQWARGRNRRSDTVDLHLPSYAGLDPAMVVCTFVQGEIHGPSVS